MRISGASFARLLDDDNRFCLLINRGRLRHRNERILSPIGGGLHLDVKGRRFLLNHGADFSGEGEIGNDLKCSIPDDQLQIVIEWFDKPQGREHSVLREVKEELGPKEGGPLTASEVEMFREKFWKPMYGYKAPTTRKVPDPMTNYLLALFNVATTPKIMAKLLAASEIKEPIVYFVTAREIKKGKAADGTLIGPISECLL